MSLTQDFPSTFSATQTTIDVLHNLDNETKKIYNDINSFMAADGHSHTGNGSDGAKIDALNPTGALHQPNPVSITSIMGVLTLIETSNSFIVGGTENVTSITGWTKGIAYIRWGTSRKLIYNATSLIIQNAADRVTTIGDIGVYEMTSAGAREVGYFPSITNGNPVGTLLFALTKTVPNGYLKANGAAISRTTYSNLVNNTFITIPTTGNKSSSSAIITNIPTTVDMAIGMHVEGAGIPVGTTISSINSLTSITLSANLTVTAIGGALTVYPYGNGDGITTVNLPDLRGEHLRSYDDGRNVDTTSFKLSTTNGSNVLSGIDYTGFMFVGMPLSGAGIPVGATVASITSATSITISANATATATLVYLTFTGRRFGSWESDAIQNITGSITNMSSTYNATPVASGALTMVSNGVGGFTGGGGSGTKITAGIDTANSVRTANETRGRSYAVPIYIKY